MFIVNLTYTVSLDKVNEYIQAHKEYLSVQYELNNFIASGAKNPRTGGIILSIMSSKKELETVLKQDPFHKADIAEYEIIEFTPSMTSKEFESLKQ